MRQWGERETLNQLLRRQKSRGIRKRERENPCHEAGMIHPDLTSDEGVRHHLFSAITCSYPPLHSSHPVHAADRHRERGGCDVPVTHPPLLLSHTLTAAQRERERERETWSDQQVET